MKKTENNLLKDGLLYFNKSHRLSPTKSQIAQGYPADFVSFNKIMAVVLSILVLMSVLFFAETFRSMMN